MKGISLLTEHNSKHLQTQRKARTPILQSGSSTPVVCVCMCCGGYVLCAAPSRGQPLAGIERSPLWFGSAWVGASAMRDDNTQLVYGLQFTAKCK